MSDTLVLELLRATRTDMARPSDRIDEHRIAIAATRRVRAPGRLGISLVR